MALRILLVLLTLVFATPAFAEDGATINLQNLMQTLIRFGAIDVKDDNLIDDYAMVTECDLYTHFYSDDFKWNEVRKAIRESLKMNVKNFPTVYHFDTQVRLDRYDFKTKTFLFTDRTVIKNVNSFFVGNGNDYQCDNKNPRFVNTNFQILLDTPVNVLGLPLSEKDAHAYLERMKKDDNDKRFVYVRFNLRIIYIAPFEKTSSGDARPAYGQRRLKDNLNTIRLEAQLDTIDFYEDENMTKLIYSYVAP